MTETIAQTNWQANARFPGAHHVGLHYKATHLKQISQHKRAHGLVGLPVLTRLLRQRSAQKSNSYITFLPGHPGVQFSPSLIGVLFAILASIWMWSRSLRGASFSEGTPKSFGRWAALSTVGKEEDSIDPTYPVNAEASLDPTRPFIALRLGNNNKRVSFHVAGQCTNQRSIQAIAPLPGEQVIISLGDGNEDVDVHIGDPVACPDAPPAMDDYQASPDPFSQPSPKIEDTSMSAPSASASKMNTPQLVNNEGQTLRSVTDSIPLSPTSAHSATSPESNPPPLANHEGASDTYFFTAKELSRTEVSPIGSTSTDANSNPILDAAKGSGLTNPDDKQVSSDVQLARGSAHGQSVFSNDVSHASYPIDGVHTSLMGGGHTASSSPAIQPKPSNPSSTEGLPAVADKTDEPASSSSSSNASQNDLPSTISDGNGELTAFYVPHNSPDEQSSRVIRLMQQLPHSAFSSFQDGAASLRLRGWVSQLHRRERLAEWRDLLQFALRVQDFDQAAKLRDRIREFADDDPEALQSRLQDAVERSEFSEAAFIRDRLKKQQLQRWARPVLDVRPGTVIMRVNQSRVAAPRSLRRTLVLILKHDSNGTLGLCLNNLLGPLDLCKAESFVDEVDAMKKMGFDSGLYDGGLGATKPVLTVLHQQKIPEVPDVDLTNDLFSLYANMKYAGQPNPTLQAAVQSLKVGETCPDQVRVFSGQMRWSAQALEAQLKDGLWFPCLLSPSLIFSHHKPEIIWNEVWALLGEWCRQHLPADQ